MKQRRGGPLDESAAVSRGIPHANIKIMNVSVWAGEAVADNI